MAQVPGWNNENTGTGLRSLTSITSQEGCFVPNHLHQGSSILSRYEYSVQLKVPCIFHESVYTGDVFRKSQTVRKDGTESGGSYEIKMAELPKEVGFGRLGLSFGIVL
jgi:hypothetical protein